MDPVDGPILASLLGKSALGCIWSFALGVQGPFSCSSGLWGILTAWKERERSEAVGWSLLGTPGSQPCALHSGALCPGVYQDEDR